MTGIKWSVKICRQSYTRYVKTEKLSKYEYNQVDLVLKELYRKRNKVHKIEIYSILTIYRILRRSVDHRMTVSHLCLQRGLNWVQKALLGVWRRPIRSYRAICWMQMSVRRTVRRTERFFGNKRSIRCCGSMRLSSAIHTAPANLCYLTSRALTLWVVIPMHTQSTTYHTKKWSPTLKMCLKNYMMKINKAIPHYSNKLALIWRNAKRLGRIRMEYKMSQIWVKQNLIARKIEMMIKDIGFLHRVKEKKK